MYEYEDKTKKQFINSEELDVADWIQHRIFVQNMSDIDRQTILGLPSAQPEVLAHGEGELSAQPERKIFSKMPDAEFEEWLYEHGICHPDIHESIPCDAVSLLIDAAINEMLPAQPEPHYCRECKWSRCHINADKYGKSEIYWRCLIWDAETDEEGYCHEWKRRQS